MHENKSWGTYEHKISSLLASQALLALLVNALISSCAFIRAELQRPRSDTDDVARLTPMKLNCLPFQLQ